jgi:acyl dehydratase
VPIDPAVATSTPYPDKVDSWDEDRVILYHLGLGAGTPPTDLDELNYVNERHLKVLPAFSVIPGFEAVRPSLQGPGLDYHLSKMLHGEQEVVVHAPLPPKAEIVSTARVESVYDKGKAALAILRADTRTADGQELFTTRYSLFIRGEGGFGGDPSPAAEPWEPKGDPDVVVEQTTLPQQAAIYRLSGDRNPLHIDPKFAAKAGFDQPILHGLCTYGMVCKAVVDNVLDGDTTAVGRYYGRFAGSVFPGETLRTKIWNQDGRILVETTILDRDIVAISNGVIETR